MDIELVDALIRIFGVNADLAFDMLFVEKQRSIANLIGTASVYRTPMMMIKVVYADGFCWFDAETGELMSDEEVQMRCVTFPKRGER